MAQLLVEILSEEIPARMQARAAEDLKRLVGAGMKEAGLEFADAVAFATPRRLALVVEGLPERQPDVSDERKGPQVGAPDKAIQGFLGAVGLALDQCETRDVKGKEFYFAVIEKKGRPTAEVLTEILEGALGALPWPKSMRWGAGETRWVRPLHSILCLFAGAVVPIKHAGINAGAVTHGHRFMAPGPIAVTDFADYRDRLKAAKVILDAGERAELIKAGAEKLAAAEGLGLKDDPALLAEVAGLVEWPVPLMGAIDAEFMEVPAEVLTESMRAHQKYFALKTEAGKLAPRFITVANIEAKDGGAAIIGGNERVLRARLADARFFWDTDRKAALESRVAKLSEITFHAKLGTVAEKVDRMESLAAELCEFIPGADRDKARSAAHLAKADLTTGMVGEFPELQGIMGRYYALNDGESDDVAEAIAQHYSPKGPGDACPTAPTAIAVALADKIDSLVGFFAIDEKPTGSRDPFALRRAALGVIRMVTENGLRLPLAEMFAAAERAYGDSREGVQGALDLGELLSFFADRLKVQMRETGVRHDLIAAVFATPKPDGGAEDDLVRLLARVAALAQFLETEDGANLLTAYKRAANIVVIEEKKDKMAYDGEIARDLLDQAEEGTLFEALDLAHGRVQALLAAENFAGAMEELAKLRPPVDAFFDSVTVNCDNKLLRANRLRLLSHIRAALNEVADFSRIEG
jgi:glycyl-tRNA synthetase beta chain